jgi:hypothetical protein
MSALAGSGGEITPIIEVSHLFNRWSVFLMNGIPIHFPSKIAAFGKFY